MPEDTVLEEVGLTQADVDGVGGHVYKARDGGCEECLGLGYRGRTGIYEVLKVQDEVRNLIMNRDDASNIKREACASGMHTLREDGAVKVLAGETSIEEVLRVTQEDTVYEAA